MDRADDLISIAGPFVTLFVDVGPIVFGPIVSVQGRGRIIDSRIDLARAVDLELASFSDVIRASSRYPDLPLHDEQAAAPFVIWGQAVVRRARGRT